MEDNAARAARASQFLRNQLRFGSATAMIVVFAFGAVATRSAQDWGGLVCGESMRVHSTRSQTHSSSCTTLLLVTSPLLRALYMSFRRRVDPESQSPPPDTADEALDAAARYLRSHVEWEAMVDNLKAEVYETRLRLMAKGAGESDSSSAGTHREEELQEGDPD